MTPTMLWWRRLRPKRRRFVPRIDMTLRVFSPALGLALVGIYSDIYSDIY